MDGVRSHEVLLRLGEMSWRCVGREYQDFFVLLGLRNQVGSQMEMSSRQLDKTVKTLHDDGIPYLDTLGPSYFSYDITNLRFVDN